MAKTTCDWTVERLPWWVNGTLDEAEAERVEAHLADCADCRDELAATRGALALYAAHLPIETLLDLIEDEAAESYGAADGGVLSRQAVEDHLGHCSACRGELALLRESRAAVEDVPGATVTAFVPPRDEPAGVSRRRRLDRRSLALAASLLLVVVAAGGWLATGWTAERRGDRIADLERRLAEVSAGQAAGEPAAEPASGEAPGEAAAALDAAAAREAEQAAEIAALTAELERLRPAAERGRQMASAVGVGPTEPWDLQLGAMRGAGGPPPAPLVEVPAGAEQISFFLESIPEGPLRLVVEDATGRRLVVRQGLTPHEHPNLGRHLTVTLSLADLPAGELRLRIFSGDEEIATRLLRVAR